MAVRPEAVILAAGIGRRFGGDVPKCLAEVNGKALLAHSLDALSEVGFRSVTIVLGHRAEMIQSWLRTRRNPMEVRLRMNRSFRLPSMHSVLCACDVLRDGGLLIESDLIFEPDLVARLLESQHPNAVCSTPPRNRRPFYIEAGKDGRVLRWGYELAETGQELVGIYKLSGPSVRDMFRKPDVEYWDPLLSLADPLYCHPCRSRWNEVDTPEELADARRAWGAGVDGDRAVSV